MRVNPVDHVESKKSIEDSFLESLGQMTVPHNRNATGDPLFTKADVLASNDELTQMLRAICVLKGITKQYLNVKYREYATEVLNEANSRISTGAGNLLSAVKRDPVSFKTFVKLFACVLGHSMDMTITLRDNDGKLEEYNYLKVMDDVINSSNK